jgi:hypothetical protein
MVGTPAVSPSKDPKAAKMVDELGVADAVLYETANLLLRRRHWSICNGPDFLSRI